MPPRALQTPAHACQCVLISVIYGLRVWMKRHRELILISEFRIPRGLVAHMTACSESEEMQLSGRSAQTNHYTRASHCSPAAEEYNESALPPERVLKNTKRRAATELVDRSSNISIASLGCLGSAYCVCSTQNGADSFRFDDSGFSSVSDDIPES